MTSTTPKVALGRVVATAGVNSMIEKDVAFRSGILEAIHRHRHGDWGDDLCEEDRAANDQALESGEARILSSYTIHGTRVWIITEWNREVTTVLFPEEY